MGVINSKINASIFENIFNFFTRIISLPIISSSSSANDKTDIARLKEDIGSAKSKVLADMTADSTNQPDQTEQTAKTNQTNQTAKTNQTTGTVQNDKNGQNNLEYITSLFNLNKLNLVNFDLNNVFILLIIYYIIFIFSKDFIKGIVTTVIYTAIITYTIIRVYNYIYTLS